MNENSPFNPKRILFLDYNSDNVNAFRNKASNLSFSVFTVAASKTITAIDLLKNNDFDLIVSQVFPDTIINGLNIVERLRNGDFGENNKNIPAVAYTPEGYMENEHYRKAGFNSYVQSSDNGNKLLKVIEKFLAVELVQV